jgi:hypothetical protein
MPSSAPLIYQLKVVLQGISPMIWRRLLVSGESTIADLHYIVQIAMGWSDDHLHQFRIHGKRYGIARIGGIWFSDDSDSVRLKNLGLRINERFSTNMISQTTGDTRSASRPSWRRSPVGIILYVLMAGGPVHLKIVAAPGGLWRYGPGR